MWGSRNRLLPVSARHFHPQHAQLFLALGRFVFGCLARGRVLFVADLLCHTAVHKVGHALTEILVPLAIFVLEKDDLSVAESRKAFPGKLHDEFLSAESPLTNRSSYVADGCIWSCNLCNGTPILPSFEERRLMHKCGYSEPG
jgi:hypothetical protein